MSKNDTQDVTETKNSTCSVSACQILGLVKKISEWKINIAEQLLLPIALFMARIHIALIFWKSGKTKIDNLENTTTLFEWEYIPAWEKNATKTILGTEITFPVPNPEFAGTMATYTELAMPVLLVLGLMGRMGAFILFGMAATIELFVYPYSSEHYFWMIILAIIALAGSGRISLDHIIRSKLIKDQKELSNTANIIMFAIAGITAFALLPAYQICESMSLNKFILIELAVIASLTMLASNFCKKTCCPMTKKQENTES